MRGREIGKERERGREIDRERERKRERDHETRFDSSSIIKGTLICGC